MAKTSNTESKTTNVPLTLRVAKEQKKAYCIAAAKNRKSLSVWVRENLDAAAEAQGVPIQ